MQSFRLRNDGKCVSSAPDDIGCSVADLFAGNTRRAVGVSIVAPRVEIYARPKRVTEKVAA